MKILFIFENNRKDDYSNQLRLAYDLLKKTSSQVSMCYVDDQEKKQKIYADIVISNSLDSNIQKKIINNKIILIYLEEYKHRKKCDLLIDYKYKKSSKCFTGLKYKINNNKLPLDFISILNVINKLKWDTNFWGYPVYIISTRILTKNILYRIDLLFKNEKVRLLQYLCDCHDRESVILAEKNNFNFKDIRITFECELIDKQYAKLKCDKEFRIAKKSEVKEIQALSKSLYKESRYYFDRNFNKKQVQEFYDQWTYKAIYGTFDDVCFVYCEKQKPVAYCTLKYTDHKQATIGLFGVGGTYSGKGYGKKLINNLLVFLSLKKIKKVLVVTQGRNYRAQRLYQNSGFLTKRTELWYHKWF